MTADSNKLTNITKTTGEPITDDRPGKWGQTEYRCYKNLAAL